MSHVDPWAIIGVIGLLAWTIAYLWVIMWYLVRRPPSFTADYGCPICDRLVFSSLAWTFTQNQFKRKLERFAQLEEHWNKYHGGK